MIALKILTEPRKLTPVGRTTEMRSLNKNASSPMDCTEVGIETAASDESTEEIQGG